MSKSISRDEKKRRLEAAREAEETAAVETLPVTVTKWAGVVNYECVLCAYSTLDAAVMEAHLRAVHGERAAEMPARWVRASEEEEASAGLAGGDVEEEIQDEVK